MCYNALEYVLNLKIRPYTIHYSNRKFNQIEFKVLLSGITVTTRPLKFRIDIVRLTRPY